MRGGHHRGRLSDTGRCDAARGRTDGGCARRARRRGARRTLRGLLLLLAREHAHAAAQDQLVDVEVALAEPPGALVHLDVGLEPLVEELAVGPGIEGTGELE